MRCGVLGTLLHTLQNTDSAVLNRLNRIMPRQAGLDVPGALHHIMIRGIDKTNILLVDGYCNGIGPIRGDEKQSHFARLKVEMPLMSISRTITKGD